MSKKTGNPIMEYVLVKKAYGIDFRKIEEGFLFDSDSFTTHAQTRNKAKTKLLKKTYCENICLSNEDNEVTYLDIPVVRMKHLDLYRFKEKEMTLSEIKESIRISEENDKIEGFLRDSKITHCLIMKRGLYYSWNYSGYTSFECYAGVYLKKEAVSYCKNEPELTCVAINNDEHNEMILNQVARLKKGLIDTYR